MCIRDSQLHGAVVHQHILQSHLRIICRHQMCIRDRETGGANFIFVTKDNTVVTPKSDSILPVSYTHLDVYKRQDGCHTVGDNM